MRWLHIIGLRKAPPAAQVSTPRKAPSTRPRRERKLRDEPYKFALALPVVAFAIAMVVFRSAPRPWDEVGTFLGSLVMADAVLMLVVTVVYLLRGVRWFELLGALVGNFVFGWFALWLAVALALQWNIVVFEFI